MLSLYRIISLIFLIIFFCLSFHNPLRAEDQPVIYTIQHLEFAGNITFSTQDLSAQIPVTIGQEYSRDSIIEGKYNLLSYYGEHGYIYAKVKENVIADESTGRVNILYEINEGKKAYIGKISIVGNTKTKDRVIWRTLTILPGEIYNRKEVFTSQRKLVLLGYFDDVKIEPANRDKEEEIVDLVVTVKERNTGLISLGTGYSTEEGVRGYARYRQINLFGKGQRLGAGVFLSERGDLVQEGREINLDFFEPYLFNTKTGFGTDLYYRRDNLDNYNLRRRGGDMYITQLSSNGEFKSTLKYRFEADEMFAIKNIIDTDIKAMDGETVNIGTFSYTLTRDTRDSLIYPHRGNLESVTLEVANTLFGSEVDYYKFSGDIRTYLQLFNSEWVLGLRATGGIAQPYGNTDSIPIFERFYAGGSESVRGYKDRYLGPKDLDGYPVGGEAVAIFNAELRFPIYKQFGGVLFYDCGNVWAEPSDVRLNELQSAVGVGLRYQTPIGPFRLDYGYRIPKADNGRFHISVGQTF
jgi:outer membrane protein insertion porin family